MKLQNIPRFRNETERDAIIQLTTYFMDCRYEELQNEDYYSLLTPEYYAVFTTPYDNGEEDEGPHIPIFQDSFTDSDINAPASGWLND
jgi:hypothetical protein